MLDRRDMRYPLNSWRGRTKSATSGWPHPRLAARWPAEPRCVTTRRSVGLDLESQRMTNGRRAVAPTRPSRSLPCLSRGVGSTAPHAGGRWREEAPIEAAADRPGATADWHGHTGSHPLGRGHGQTAALHVLVGEGPWIGLNLSRKRASAVAVTGRPDLGAGRDVRPVMAWFPPAFGPELYRERHAVDPESAPFSLSVPHVLQAVGPGDRHRGR